MESFVAQMLNEFERGKLTRRQLIETLAAAAVSIGTGSIVSVAAQAPEASASTGFKTLTVNHISYGCPAGFDLRIARDFYIDLMGMESVKEYETANGGARLVFSPKGTTPLGTPAGTPVTHLIIRGGGGGGGGRRGASGATGAAGSSGASGAGGRGAPATGGAAAISGASGNGGARAGGRPPVQVHIDHIAYTIADWDHKKVKAELIKRGLKFNGGPPLEETSNSFHVNSPDGYDLQICGVKLTALS